MLIFRFYINNYKYHVAIQNCFFKTERLFLMDWRVKLDTELDIFAHRFFWVLEEIILNFVVVKMLLSKLDELN